MHTVTNEHGEVRALTLTATKAHNQFIPVLGAIPHSLRKYGHADMELMYTDNVRADKAELESAIPALLKDVSPVPSSSLEPLALLPGWEVYTLRSTFQINNRINTIMEDLNDLPLEKSIHIAVDFEWPVDTTNGIHGRVALISLAYNKFIYLILVIPFVFYSIHLLVSYL